MADERIRIKWVHGLDLRKLADGACLRLGQAFAVCAIILLAAIAAGLFFKSLPVLTNARSDAFFSDNWHPSMGEFGIFPFVVGTISTTVVAMFLAAPLCLFAAIYLSEYAGRKVRENAGLLIEVLAGVPSVIFGLWGILFVVPLVRDVIGPWFGTPTSGFSILSAGIVLALMVAPIIVSLSVEVMRGVPKAMREASLGLGATRAQTVWKVILPESRNGLVAAVVLGFSRAIGETMAVMMVVGNVPGYPKGIFDPAYPLTALIANNYGEMMSLPLYDSALMLAALVLLFVVLVFNLIARGVLRSMQGASRGGKNASKAIKIR